MRLPPSVHVLSIDPPPDHVLVAIGIHSNRGHVGIFYRTAPGDPFSVLHMCDHHKLRNQPLYPPQWTSWVSLNLITDEAEQIAASCEHFADTTPLPYAFSSPRGFFLDKFMRVNPQSHSLGLTC